MVGQPASTYIQWIILADVAVEVFEQLSNYERITKSFDLEFSKQLHCLVVMSSVLSLACMYSGLPRSLPYAADFSLMIKLLFEITLKQIGLQLIRRDYIWSASFTISPNITFVKTSVIRSNYCCLRILRTPSVCLTERRGGVLSDFRQSLSANVEMVQCVPFIASLSMVALSHGTPASAGTYRNSYRVPRHDKRDTLYLKSDYSCSIPHPSSLLNTLSLWYILWNTGSVFE